MMEPPRAEWPPCMSLTVGAVEENLGFWLAERAPDPGFYGYDASI